MPNNYFVHPLLRARDWQHRPQLDEVHNWWQDGGRGVCALVGMGGAGKTAIAEKTEKPYEPYVPMDEIWPYGEKWDPPEYVGVFEKGDIVGYHCRNDEIELIERELKRSEQSKNDC